MRFLHPVGQLLIFVIVLIPKEQQHCGQGGLRRYAEYRLRPSFLAFWIVRAHIFNRAEHRAPRLVPTLNTRVGEYGKFVPLPAGFAAPCKIHVVAPFKHGFYYRVFLACALRQHGAFGRPVHADAGRVLAKLRKFLHPLQDVQPVKQAPFAVGHGVYLFPRIVAV